MTLFAVLPELVPFLLPELAAAPAIDN